MEVLCHGNDIRTIQTWLEVIGRKIFAAVRKVKGIGGQWHAAVHIFSIGKGGDYRGVQTAGEQAALGSIFVPLTMQGLG